MPRMKGVHPIDRPAPVSRTYQMICWKGCPFFSISMGMCISLLSMGIGRTGRCLKQEPLYLVGKVYASYCSLLVNARMVYTSALDRPFSWAFIFRQCFLVVLGIVAAVAVLSID
eukprot:14139181-Ditylum_brightwellii.AAC.1